MTAILHPDLAHASDPELASLLAARNPAAARLVTERNNRRLFRTAWSILKNRAEAEDVVQAAYLKAFTAIGGFRGDCALSTWLTRITINEALERRRKRLREVAAAGDGVVMIETYRDKLAAGSYAEAPDSALAREEIRRLLEEAIGRLPDDFRLAFVLGEVEGLSVEETADALGVAPATIKTRRLRARRRLQDDLGPQLRAALEDSFPFAGADCEALTLRVMQTWCGEP